MENSGSEVNQRLELFDTKVVVTRQDLDIPNQPFVQCLQTLKEVLDKYTFSLGYQNEHLLDVLITLMTVGKILVEFRAYTERLELRNPASMMTRHDTIQLFNDYLESQKEEKKVNLANVTRRIVVQAPRKPSSPLPPARPR